MTLAWATTYRDSGAVSASALAFATYCGDLLPRKAERPSRGAERDSGVRKEGSQVYAGVELKVPSSTRVVVNAVQDRNVGR